MKKGTVYVVSRNMLGQAPEDLQRILATSRMLGMATGVSFASAILAAIVGDQSAHGISPERVFKADHLAFL